MREVLLNAAYRRLFSAQIVALLGTGLLTAALGLLAFELAGAQAGVVLGVALTIKMLAYVGAGPILIALTASIPRRTLMVAADVVRAATALALPFVTEVWQIYALIFVLQCASATFTPAFQAVIPEILPSEAQYTRALSLSRLAYDLEALASPAIAALLLTVVPASTLFAGTSIGFLASAALVAATRFPPRVDSAGTSFWDRLTLGVRVFVRSPGLRTLLALNLVVAAPVAMVIVNTVVLVQDRLARPEQVVAVLLAAYGAGSMVVALLLPRMLDRLPERTVLLSGATIATLGLLVAAPLLTSWWALIGLWAVLGAAVSAVMTVSPRLVRRAATTAERPAVYAAQFALSHACYIVTYPVAGVLGDAIGLGPVSLVLAAIAAVGTALALIASRPRRGHTDPRPDDVSGVS